jgi:hypothetical protein
MKTLNEKLFNAIKNFKGLEKIMDCDFFIFSRDGIIVYKNLSDEIRSGQELGALSGGVCQAAVQLATMYKLDGAEDFRLDFSSSNNGLFILPIPVKDHEYFLINLYRNHMNPGMNKIVFRSLVNHLVDHKEIFETKLKEEFLFNDIKDHEIDQLFKEVRL